ncbi:hypothetical protein FIU97_16985 [Roseivivax sp. THAF40]|uniref:hypothetical protein n=1 Tax=unclassified Roseivivax TaxID=2639302 RepID=UPI001267CCCA|nr:MULTISPECIES: hypothetical protein [unclassified Roseivivax]QFS84453.1 hypothetical protein FIV09_16570 [Roseivivax sp. THAF197b]QFT48281.1 hypothetical protein FIU97_16985 [Roseivivax sp. THAF40]
MSGSIRPEARAFLLRWREALIGAGTGALGLLIYAAALGWVVAGFGLLVAVAGLGLMALGVQRGRFRSGEDGPGIVTVTEGRLMYFGPLSGGVADLDDVTELALDRDGQPDHWLITHRSGPPLHIPVTASGADGLFDAFAGLPGFDTEAMLRAMRAPGTGRVQIWMRADAAPLRPRLH